MNFYDLRTFVMKYSCRDLRTLSAISFGWKVVFANFYAFLAGLIQLCQISGMPPGQAQKKDLLQGNAAVLLKYSSSHKDAASRDDGGVDHLISLSF